MIIGKLLGALLRPILNRKVLIGTIVVVVLVVAIFIVKDRVTFPSGPSEGSEELPVAQEFICGDGSKVTRAELCPPEGSLDDAFAEEDRKNATGIVPDPPVKEPEPVVLEDPIYPDITSWTHEEVVAAMGTVNAMYKFPLKRKLVYDADEKGAYYYQGNSQNRIEDPFWLLRNQYFYNSYEWSVNGLRTNVLESPESYVELTEAKHQDASLKILNPETFVQWQEITCARMESCRNLVAVNCTRGNHTLFIWNYYPEQQNTAEKRFSLMSFDDKGASLKTFELFYCEPA